MPNWCYTEYKIEGCVEEVNDLFQKLSSLEEREESLLPNGFGKNWLGNVVHLFGGDWNNIYCRGEITGLEMQEKTILSINTLTAWGDLPEVWDLVLSKYHTLKYYFYAEECGMIYYATNDAKGIHFPDRFIVDTDESREFHETEEEAIEDLEEILGKQICSKDQIKDLIKEWQESNPDGWLNFHEIKVISPTKKENV